MTVFTKIQTFAKSKPYIFAGIISIIVIVIVLVIVLPIVLTKNGSSGSSGGSGGSIVGAWSNTIGCGNGSFNIISLTSALPNKYNADDLNLFFGDIKGTYAANLSTGTTKYLISIGTDTTSTTDWKSFLNYIINNINNSKKFIDECKKRGIVGVDFNLQHVYPETTLLVLVKQIKEIDNNFIVMYSVSNPSIFGTTLLTANNYDYLTVIFTKNNIGDNCIWDGWAEYFLSKGTAGCKYPNHTECNNTPTSQVCINLQSQFAKSYNLDNIIPSKVLLGLCIDNDDTTTFNVKLNTTILYRANQLNQQYGGAGIMIWQIPGTVNTDNITQLNNMGFKIDATKC